MTRRLALLSGVALLATVIAVAVAGAQTPGTGVIGPSLGVLDNGRALHPYGALVGLGNFPTGGAVTPDGRFYWTVSTGRGPNDVRIVSVASGQVVQVLRVPGASGGIVMDPKHPLVYVSGVADSPDSAQSSPPGTPGAKGDDVLVFRYGAAGRARFDHVIGVPAPSSASAPQNFPPTSSAKVSWPDRLAISPDGSTLLVPLNLADQAAVVDAARGSVRYVKTGNYPYGAAISRDGRLGFVSNETPGTVSVIDLRSATKIKDIQVGAHLSHPEALVSDPAANRVYVAVTNSDEVGVIDVARQQLERTLSVGRPQGLGTAPDALAVTPDGSELLVAEAGGDELSVFALPPHPGVSSAPGTTLAPYQLIGHIPTAQYPTDVQVSRSACAAPASRRRTGRARRHHRRGHRRRHRPNRRRVRRHRRPVGEGRGARPRRGSGRARRHPLHRRHRRPRRRALRRHRGGVPVGARGACQKLLYISAKGLGTGPNLNGPQPNSPNDTDNLINAFEYLPLINLGTAGLAAYPSDATISGLDASASAQLVPANAQTPPAGTPLRPGGPIKHVFYIVRENRTYDQVLGDVARGDGDPKLTLFGQSVTPNSHALVQRFGLLDHLYANSEASIDGHFWTSAASVSDYVNKNWFQNYAGRKRPYDFGVYSVTWPANGFLFDQADRQGISYFNYGEAIAGTVPLTDKDRTQSENQRVATKFGKSDLGALDNVAPVPGNCYPNDASIGSDAINGQPVFDSSRPLAAPPQSGSRYDCFRSHFLGQLASGSVPTFNYLVLSNDHTQVLDPGKRTPAAMVADNDRGLGQIVDLISHSSIWSSSAIFVIEDDSQDGPDHVDAHRTVGLVISPYARQSAVIHTRYDMLSMTRSMELIMGMRPLGLFDALATPMYDAFGSTPSNSAPYTALTPAVNLLAVNPSTTAGARESSRLPKSTDAIPQHTMDRLLWESVHGYRSPPPPPGPNAVPGA